jgi:hypothetical protein
MYRKYLFIIRSLQKNIHLVTQSLQCVGEFFPACIWIRIRRTKSMRILIHNTAQELYVHKII